VHGGSGYSDSKIHGIRRNSMRGGVYNNDLLYAYEMETERWRRQQIEARIAAARREQMKVKIIREQARKIEEQVHQRREAEKRRLAEERVRILNEMKEQQRREQERRSGAIVDAWKRYDSRWTALLAPSSGTATSQSPATLRFKDIPWPVVRPPLNVSQIEPASIGLFLLSPHHSRGLSTKDRLRNAQLRWHPDRFRRILRRVVEQDKAAVEEGVGIVSRCLNDLMSREQSISRQVCNA
jgi:hypothetical protein